jgi:hypothetical protein
VGVLCDAALNANGTVAAGRRAEERGEVKSHVVGKEYLRSQVIVLGQLLRGRTQSYLVISTVTCVTVRQL